MDYDCLARVTGKHRRKTRDTILLAVRSARVRERAPSSLMNQPLFSLGCRRPHSRKQMNILGDAVIKSFTGHLGPGRAASSTYRLITLQDDLDLAPGVVKYQRGGGPRGHNGVRSVIRALPPAVSRDFHRLRIGIGRPESRSQVASWVMKPLGRAEVEACSWVEDTGRGGAVLEMAWKEIERIGWADEEEMEAQAVTMGT